MLGHSNEQISFHFDGTMLFRGAMTVDSKLNYLPPFDSKRSCVIGRQSEPHDT